MSTPARRPANGHRFPLPPNSRPVIGLGLHIAAPLGGTGDEHWFGELGVVVAGEDRTGLLRAALAAVATETGALVVEGFGRVLSGRAFLNLVVVAPAAGPPALHAVARSVAALSGSADGEQYLIAGFDRLRITAPNRAAVLRDVCAELARCRWNVREFALATRTARASGEPVARTELELQIELPRVPVATRAEVCASVRNAAPGEITCD